MGRIRIGAIGTNFISDNFADAISHSKKAELTAIYSRKLDTGAAFAARHNLKKVYTSLDEMLADSEVDAIYVASPHIAHAEQTVRALDAGKHVLCEKMIAADLDGFIKQKEARIRSGKALLEAMRPDFDPALGIIKSVIPRLGRLRRAHLEYCQYSSRYDRFKNGEILNAFDPKMKNTALADIGIYPLHTCVALFGKPDRVSSSSVFLPNGFEGMGQITLGYDGMIATVTYSKITESVNPSVIEGENGSVTFDKLNAPSRITLNLRGCKPELLDYTPIPNNMLYEIDAFADMVRGVSSFQPYLDVSETTMRIVDEVYRTSEISRFFKGI